MVLHAAMIVFVSLMLYNSFIFFQEAHMLPKLGFSLQAQYDRPITQIIERLKDAGFSAVSPVYSRELPLASIADCVDSCSMVIQSLHAPLKVAPLWQEDPAVSADIFSSIIETVDACAQFQIPIMVIHSWQGLIYTFPDTPLYFDNFDRIIDYAQQNKVSVAFENLEGEEYLNALMARYRNVSHVGFCWDSGHEHCYPHKLDFLECFGDRLIMTHLNDNFGLHDPGGIPSGKDDLHYIPGDGDINWESTLDRLAAAKKQDILNFELKLRPGTCYEQLTAEDFILRAGRLCRKLAERYTSKIE